MLALKIAYGVTAVGAIVLGFIVLMELLEIYQNMRKVATLTLTLLGMMIAQLVMLIILKDIYQIILISILIVWLTDLLFFKKAIQKTIIKGFMCVLAFLRMLYYKALSIRKGVASKKA